MRADVGVTVLPIDFDKLDENVQNMISQLQIDVHDHRWRQQPGLGAFFSHLTVC